MPSFLAFFRPKPKPRSKSSPPASRWPRLRHSQSTVMPLTQQVQPPAETEVAIPVQVGQGQDGADDTTSCHHTEQLDDRDESCPLKRQSSNIPQPPHHRNDGTDNSQAQSQSGSQMDSQRGSKRIKDLISRFRSSRSQDQSSVSEAPQIPLPQDAAGDPVTDPIKKDVFSRNPSADDGQLEETQTPDQLRNVSAQTVQSQDSSATVYRHPSQRIPMPIHEQQEDVFWASLLDFRPKSQKDTPAHPIDPSDPFSDGKVADCPPRQSIVSSHYSGDRSKKRSQPSVHSQGGEAGQSSKPPSSHHTSVGQATRISSVSSHGSRTSRFSRVDPAKAAALFDAQAAKLGIPISIHEDESTTEKNRAEEELESQSRSRRRFGRVRAAQSISALGGEPSPKPNRLRRAKTFANLGRRSSPMSSLRGKPIEDIARLGGHSYLMLPLDLAPAPLQLPACIVAMVMYLKKSFPKANPMPRLFEEPGDMKAATRLYNHFASQVLLAERDSDRIAMTMRVVALPNLETESDMAALLSVGWVLKEILAGLPNGLLGSARLHKVLHTVYLGGTNPYLVRMITFAIMALTSEMECALICAVFGLLTSLLRVNVLTSLEMPFKGPGGQVRTVATHSQLDPTGLARVFAPLLVGGRRRSAERSVEQEIEEERVMGMLMEHWGGINRLLWDLTENSARGRKQENED